MLVVFSNIHLIVKSWLIHCMPFPGYQWSCGWQVYDTVWKFSKVLGFGQQALLCFDGYGRYEGRMCWHSCRFRTVLGSRKLMVTSDRDSSSIPVLGSFIFVKFLSDFGCIRVLCTICRRSESISVTASFSTVGFHLILLL